MDKDVELSLNERRECFNTALEKLEEGEQAHIEGMAEALVKAVKRKSPLLFFSIDGALEVLASVGIFLNGRGR